MITYQNSSRFFSKNAVFSMERTSRVSNLHWHEAIEFVYILKGKLRFTLNAHSFEGVEGDLITVNSSIVHSFFPIEDGTEYFFLIADDNFFRSNNLYGENTVFESKINTDEVKRLFSEMMGEAQRGDEFSNASTLAVLMSLFIYLNRYHKSGFEEAPLSEQKKLKMVRSTLIYLQEHYKERLSVQSIADALHFSKSYLSHSFKEITHTSLISYINLLRCQSAQALMLEGAGVSEAAEECGFSELSYFTRVFKKTIGMLPSEVRGEIFSFNSHGG